METYYAEPDELLKKRRFADYKKELIDPLFPKDPSIRIGDIGCGYGLFLDACRRLGYAQVEGVEQGAPFIAYAKRELGIDTIAQGDLFDYLASKSDGHFDVLVALNIVEHVSKERVPELLALVHAKVKPGGMFIMEVPNADSPLGVHTYFTDLTHEFAYSRTLALRLLKLAGFSDLKVRYQHNIRHPLVRLAQKVMAKVVGFEHGQMFSANLIVVGYKK